MASRQDRHASAAAAAAPETATKPHREITSSKAEFISGDHHDHALIVVFMHAGVLNQRTQREGTVNAGEREARLMLQPD